MGMLKAVGDFFRSATGKNETDKYSIISSISDVLDIVSRTLYYTNLAMKDTSFSNTLQDKGSATKGPVSPQTKAIQAYRLYVRNLPPHEQSLEKARPFSTVVAGLEAMSGNLTLIEDNYSELFSQVNPESIDSSIRTSSLMVLGYIESVSHFTDWVLRMIDHVRSPDGGTPFQTISMIDNAEASALFVGRNLIKWNPTHKGFLNDLKQMHSRGIDVAMKTGDAWVDDIIHDQQLTDPEQNLMTAGLRNPFLMLASGSIARYQERVALFENRKNWLISKIAAEEGRLRGLDPNSQEYHKLQKAIDYYASVISKHEQKLERMH